MVLTRWRQQHGVDQHLMPGISDALLVQLQDLLQIVLGEDLGVRVNSFQPLILDWLGLVL